jgi:hypothetical protein
VGHGEIQKNCQRAYDASRVSLGGGKTIQIAWPVAEKAGEPLGIDLAYRNVHCRSAVNSSKLTHLIPKIPSSQTLGSLGVLGLPLRVS